MQKLATIVSDEIKSKTGNTSAVNPIICPEISAAEISIKIF